LENLSPPTNLTKSSNFSGDLRTISEALPAIPLATSLSYLPTKLENLSLPTNSANSSNFSGELQTTPKALSATVLEYCLHIFQLI
jgi:hypothetical protein